MHEEPHFSVLKRKDYEHSRKCLVETQVLQDVLLPTAGLVRTSWTIVLLNTGVNST